MGKKKAPIEGFDSLLTRARIHPSHEPKHPADGLGISMETPMYDALYAWCRERAKI